MAGGDVFIPASLLLSIPHFKFLSREKVIEKSGIKSAIFLKDTTPLKKFSKIFKLFFATVKRYSRTRRI
jgi:hypothetical protein